MSGCDYSGTVIAVGSAVEKCFSLGDRVAGTAHGTNPERPFDGCFAEYAVVKGDLTIHIPSFMSFESAATLPLE